MRSNGFFPNGFFRVALLCGVFCLALSQAAAAQGSLGGDIAAKKCFAISANPLNPTLNVGQNVDIELDIWAKPSCEVGEVVYSFTALTPSLSLTDPGNGYDLRITVQPGAHRNSRILIDATVFDFAGDLRGTARLLMDVTVPDGLFEGPDFIVAGFDGGSTTAPIEGVPHTVRARIQNVGSTTYTGNLWVGLEIAQGLQSPSDQLCDQTQLAPGASCYASWTLTFPQAGHYGLAFTADVREDVEEESEGNNANSYSLQVQDDTFPDLIIDPFTVQGPVRVGTTYPVLVRARNIGGGSTVQNFMMRFETPEGSEETSIPCAALQPGEICERIFQWTPSTAGNAQLVAVVDSRDWVDESNEGNNNTPLTVNVEPPTAGLPDFYFHVNGVTVSPADPQQGDLLTFTIQMHNSGASVSGFPYPDMMISGSGIVNQTHQCVNGIPNGGNCTVQVQVWADTAGPQFLHVIADPSDRFDEIHESNNSRTLNYVVDDGAGSVTCQGTWVLTGIGGTDFNTSSQGSLVDNCLVYFGANTPDGCFVTSGADGLVAVWHRPINAPCPTSAVVTSPAGDVWSFSVSVQP